MHDLESIIELLRENLPELKNRFSVSKIGVFGSYVKGNQSDNSDVDIYIEFDKVPGLEFMEIADHLERIVQNKVDLLTPSGLKSIRNSRIRQDIEKSITYV
ncbi:nucleotidyltransferase [Mesotoga sp. Brook.08.YT.4.2.5.1]|uniref:nucleotidyltransferase family protein n=1 Tax=unclassified Mesotoga TaxID=1184398 RepID=UPI000C9BE29C|nr:MULTISPECIES: nucleotidyltransferase family protein [unclassified Mesotoga]PNE20179.1 nucleotidyltransferase [Mesotoga sp. Brook.08.YT.4.2.5.1]PNS40790.1 nucleotidyltransferase [Mesotoga sp. B105.6.4]RAO96729.1 DNA polymerase III subunit beta [Mesotoga sp. Brook.08.YT.4.2.5.4.]RDI93315.1 nucleotidyltransferase [Mesotoga sp. Brook.08.YT.4.2.5.2.]